MAHAVVDATSAFIARNLINSLGEPIKCLLNVEDNVKSMKEMVEGLLTRKDDLVKMIEDEERHERVRTRSVEKWLEKVDKIQSDCKDIMEKYSRLCQCFGVHSLDIRRAYRVSKRATNMISAVEGLLKKADGFASSVVVNKMPPGHMIKMPSITGVGLHATLQQLLNCIIGDAGIIGLHGMGGVGKTALLHELYNKIMTNFEDAMLLEVTENCSVEDIQSRIGVKLDLALREDEGKHARRDRIYQYLKGRTYLIILDDVWDDLNLEDIGIPRPNRSSKSRIVIAARSAEVFNLMEVTEKIKVKCLPWEEAWKLFLNKVGEELVCSDQHIEDLAKKVARKCDGLPLALKTIGLALHGTSTIEQWEQTIWNMDNDPSMITGMEKIFRCLKRSYDHLKRDELRKCFLYCALFPEDCSFERQVLARDFICHGVLDVGHGKAPAYRKGIDVTHKLASVGMLHIATEGEDKVKMHPMMRSTALWIASNCGEASGKYLVQAGSGLENAPYATQWKDAQAISLMYNKVGVLPSAPDCPNLKVLILAVNEELRMLPSGFFTHMTSLQVLDLSWTSLEELPVEIGLLVNLHNLGVNNTQLTSLPKELGCLTKLEYLDISWIPLEYIPNNVISRLAPTLQVLRIFKSYSGWKVSKSGRSTTNNQIAMEELEGLEHLKILDITINTRDQLTWLCNHPRLANAVDNLLLGRLQEMETIPDPALVENMKSMTTLVISNSRDLNEVVIGCGSGGWSWSLSTLKLEAQKKMRRIVYRQTEQGVCLKWLRVLEISLCPQIQEVVDPNSHVVFSALQVLLLRSLQKLRSICVDMLSTFPCLRTLEVSKCRRLRSLPSKMPSCNSLKCIKGESEWWEELVWQEESDKSYLEKFFKVD